MRAPAQMRARSRARTRAWTRARTPAGAARATTRATGTAAAAVTDAQANRDASQGEVDASSACVKYCACMAMNCQEEVFANGCLHECAAQTTWDLECRANMCSLVPSEPANDHCTHAFGVNECLDK